MKIFVADNNNRIRKICKDNGIGILSSPSYFRPPPHDMSYILDNGAFCGWDEHKFYKTIKRLVDININPYFISIPDVVGDREKSLARSEEHIDQIPDIFRKYFVVQDGMTKTDIFRFLQKSDGLFVGGTKIWKWRNAHWIIDLAHNYGKKCHIGRVGTIIDYTRAYNLGADSVDGSGPSRNNRMDIPISFIRSISSISQISSI